MVALREVGVMPEELAFKAASVSVRALISTFCVFRIYFKLEVVKEESGLLMCILYV
jgi:hypothetical protein